MGLLMYNNREQDYMTSNITEAFKLIGQDALLYQVESSKYDIYDDREVTHIPSVPIGLIFENNPTPILKKNNWLVEDEENPYIAYLSIKDSTQNKVKLSEDMLIEVKSTMDVSSTRLLRVSNLKASFINPWVFIAKLVPYRPKYDRKPETPQTEITIAEPKDNDFSYLNRN